MTGKVNIYKAGEIDVRVKYSARRSIGITVEAYKGAIIRVPYKTSPKLIEQILINKSNWIRKAVDHYSSVKKLDHDQLFLDGESIMFLGKKHLLKITHSGKYFVRQSDNIIEVGINGINDPEIVKGLLEKWYKMIAKKIFTEIFYELLEKYIDYRFYPIGFTVRTMKKRWGSCTSKGKISISYDLIRIDRIYGEYVIIHELCHLIHHNHSARYYNLLSEVFPQWKQKREELKQYIR